MGLALDTDTSLFLSLELEMNEQKACEHSQHSDDRSTHQGVAEWYLALKCPSCGNERNVKAVCDSWKQFVTNGAGGSIFCSGRCKVGFPNYEWIILVCERIEK